MLQQQKIPPDLLSSEDDLEAVAAMPEDKENKRILERQVELKELHEMLYEVEEDKDRTCFSERCWDFL